MGIVKNKIGVLLTGITGKDKKKYEKIVSDLGGVIVNEFDLQNGDAELSPNDDVNFKYVVAPKLIRSEKLILAIVQNKVIVKPSFLDSCKKAKKWVVSEPFCWANDAKLISFIPSGDSKEVQLDDPIKDQVDIIMAIRKWQRMDASENIFAGKNIFIWVPNGDSNTYSKILRAIKANVYSVHLSEDDDYKNMHSELLRQCKEISIDIDEIYVENPEEIKKSAKSWCRQKKKKKKKKRKKGWEKKKKKKKKKKK